jgi:hypothetical protein
MCQKTRKNQKFANCAQGHLVRLCEAYLARRTYVEQIKAAAAERREKPTTGATSYKKSVDDAQENGVL